jgi:hypothetical protein
MFGTKKHEIIEGRRILHTEERHNLYSSSNIIRMIKSMGMTWDGYVAHVWENRNAFKGFMAATRKKTTRKT